MAGITLVTFDIDGTICRMKREGEARPPLHLRSFSHAFSKCFSIDASIDEVAHHGCTDPLILMKVLLARGYDKQLVIDKLPAMKEAMVEFAREHEEEAAEGMELLPGVRELLEALKGREDVCVGLVTGNLEEIAWGKMRRLGVEHLFSQPHFGGFGSDFCSLSVEDPAFDRGELVKIACKRRREMKPDVPIVRRFHIGDAPADVRAAELGGAEAIGVLTGTFGAEELSQAAPSCKVRD
ncbi:hypothetical protein GUITHDRAFT_72129, partial [Guillardia theta CCMP2712]